MHVAVHYNATADGARDTVVQLERAGVRTQLFQSDLTEADAPERLIADVARAFGGLDVLVNSAAIMKRTPFGEISVRDWDTILALNLRAPFFLAQAAAPFLKARQGAIINIADLAAYETWPGYLPHGLSKGGIVQMTRGLARVLAPEIRVNGIAPGTVLLPDDWTEREREKLDRTTPLGRQGSPDDVTQAVLYLLRADYVTGETIIVDGGRHVRG
jgi:NAD(P)-dependent dehydrogenase (short-subunit alcohol dehydrogenase family)